MVISARTPVAPLISLIVTYLSSLKVQGRLPNPALRQFRLLEDCLRLDYHPTVLPAQVQVWLQNLKAESEAPDGVRGGSR